jgi:abequosyltransferase
VSDPEKIELSICIATFNRAKFIGETLDSLLPQLCRGVELVILDGGSSDQTEQIVGDYAARSSRIRYIRQTTNNGVDRDFDRAVELALGEYCWLFSDDDLVKAGGVAIVLSQLAKRRSLYIVNAEVRSHDLSVLLEPRRLLFDDNVTYASDGLDRLFVETGPYLTFIGCVVIRRDLWMERLREPYFGSQFIHMGVIFQRALSEGSEVIAAALITIRYGNASWKSKEFEIWMYRWPTLVWSLPGLSDAAKCAVSPPKPWVRPKTLMLYRAKGGYSPQEFQRWVRPRSSALESVLPRLIAYIPGGFTNLLAIAYYSLMSRGSAMPLADLRNSRFYIGKRA